MIKKIRKYFDDILYGDDDCDDQEMDDIEDY